VSAPGRVGQRDASAPDGLGPTRSRSRHTGLGIVVLHRAQKALLQSRLPHLAGAVDTVERFQGGERDLIIVSATVSDLAYAQSESDFLLEPRRLTVAVSRPKRKLIVLASQALFTLMPADLDDYERGALWKHLRHACVSPALGSMEAIDYGCSPSTRWKRPQGCCKRASRACPTPHLSDATVLLPRAVDDGIAMGKSGTLTPLVQKSGKPLGQSPMSHAGTSPDSALSGRPTRLPTGCMPGALTSPSVVDLRAVDGALFCSPRPTRTPPPRQGSRRGGVRGHE